jgi:hypothetical protein
MDQVFSSCAYSIGLLDTQIDSQVAFDALARVLTHCRDASIARSRLCQVAWYDPIKPQMLTEVIRLLSQISADRWFTRNWTYQEASCGQDRMQLLIPHKLVDGSSNTQGCPREITLRLSELWDVFSMIYTTADDILGQASEFKGDDITRMIELCVQAWEQQRRQSCPCSFEVATQMQSRDNSMVIDRLAITANLC